MIFEDRLHVQRRAILHGKLGHLRLAHGTNAQLVDALVEALRQKAVDHFLADFRPKAPPDHRFRHLAGAESGNLGLFTVSCGHFGPRAGHFFRGHVDHQLPGALGIQNRAVRMLVLFFGVIVVMLGFRRFRVVFEGAAGSQNIPSGLAP